MSTLREQDCLLHVLTFLGYLFCWGLLTSKSQYCNPIQVQGGVGVIAIFWAPAVFVIIVFHSLWFPAIKCEVYDVPGICPNAVILIWSWWCWHGMCLNFWGSSNALLSNCLLRMDVGPTLETPALDLKFITWGGSFLSCRFVFEGPGMTVSARVWPATCCLDDHHRKKGRVKDNLIAWWFGTACLSDWSQRCTTLGTQFLPVSEVCGKGQCDDDHAWDGGLGLALVEASRCLGWLVTFSTWGLVCWPMDLG